MALVSFSEFNIRHSTFWAEMIYRTICYRFFHSIPHFSQFIYASYSKNLKHKNFRSQSKTIAKGTD